jgi:hypothetical protein
MFKNVDKKAIVELIKEGLRIAFLAALAAVVLWAQSLITGLDPNSVTYFVATYVLKLADKWVHENQNIKANGISPV